MSDKINVTLSPDKLQVSPGGSVETTATIKNTSDVVEAYSIVVEGIDPQWCVLSVSSLSLFPGDQEQVRLTIQPPRTSAGKAGPYNVIIKVAARRDPAIETTAQLALEVGSFLLFDLELAPRKAKGRKGCYQVIVTNSGNLATTYTLAGQDPDEVCRFDFKPQTVTVEAGASAEVPLVVDPQKKPFIGKARVYSFTVTATPHATEAVAGKSVEGQLECRRRFRRSTLLIAVFVVVAIIAIVSLFALGGGGDIAGPTLAILFVVSVVGIIAFGIYNLVTRKRV